MRGFVRGLFVPFGRGRRALESVEVEPKRKGKDMGGVEVHKKCIVVLLVTGAQVDWARDRGHWRAHRCHAADLLAVDEEGADIVGV